MTEQGHKDHLSALDASFLMNERSGVHLHAGAILIFDGPAMSYGELRAHVSSRSHLFPRMCQKLAFPPAGTGRPIWVDDRSFSVKRHIHQADLPKPGSEKELQELIGQILSQKLDRTRPLWEFWLIRGLSEDRFALVCKVHHCLVDGISGVNLSKVLFDLEPTQEKAAAPERRRAPNPEPSRLEMAIDGLREQLRQMSSLARFAARAIKHPATAVRRGAEALRGLAAVARAWLVNPAPDTFLNVKTGQERSLEWTRFELDRFKEIKNTVGATVNDVVLAVTARALGRFFARLGQPTDGVKLFGLVPVSARASDDPSLFGNRVLAARGPLPLDAKDPLKLLKRIHEEMNVVKRSKELVGAHVISAINDYLPPPLLAQASRLVYSTRLFNLIVTNLPGLQIPLYVLGRRLLDFFPVTCLPHRHALAIMIMSYNGAISFCFLADRDVLPELNLLREDTELVVSELLKAIGSEPVLSSIRHG